MKLKHFNSDKINWRSGIQYMSLLAGLFVLTSFNELPKRMKLVWADEFNYTGLPDSLKWGYDIGDGCPENCSWGNNELQYYTEAKLKNARVEAGNLIIEAHREHTGTRDYSSARLVSKNKGDWTYGKIEVKAKLPKGRGVWPAIWMLPTDWLYGGWPASGEIDIMEHVGYAPDSLFGTVHTARFNHILGTQQSKGLYCSTLSEEFHTYGIMWDDKKIEFLFDDKVYHSFANRKEGSDAWPFDLDFHMVLNIAVGGNWGGKMGVDTSIWPQQMLIDYVRVYQY
jgi:beta-glucanase (GH16 family)